MKIYISYSILYHRLINTYLSGLHITEHANKQTQHCSGGTRRKLSYAMAMVGAPKVVLLDEPSTGMDPKSKRFLWDTILASKGERGAILTTHSMEEADALSSRVGIMVKGELRYILLLFKKNKIITLQIILDVWDQHNTSKIYMELGTL